MNSSRASQNVGARFLLRPGRNARLVGLVVLALASPGTAAAAPAAPALRVAVERSPTPLEGPWKFRTGDDMRWAAPDFDDSAWEAVDLTPRPGAHDGDVGLTNYVPGWVAQGHAGYAGYAWYRARVAVAASPGTTLALLAPAYVDDAYQLYWDGRLLGESGDFSGATPVAYSTKPGVFLPPPPGARGDVVVAVRVWMGPHTSREPEAGGIHIAPALGDREAVEARYRVQWQQTALGYVVDAVEPFAFLLLAALAWAFARPERSKTFHAWLGAALALTAARRANQAFYFWTSYESLDAAVFANHVVLEPLGLAAWLMAWRGWFGLRAPRWLPPAAAGVTALTVGAQLAGDRLAPFVTALRATMAALLLAVAYAGVRGRGPDRRLALAAMGLVATGLFARELSALGVPGIWFPFGTGVSRTQYAYALLIVALAALLVRRVVRLAAGATAPGVVAPPPGSRPAGHLTARSAAPRARGGSRPARP
jgi:hypothetical protein